jgi:hypothetical protein
MKSMFDPPARGEIIHRLRLLRPDSPRQWGTLDAPRMIAHLGDQMRLALGDIPPIPIAGIFRHAIFRFLAIYLLPWPKGKAKAPPESFSTPPSSWDTDLTGLIGLLERLAQRGPAGSWPDHPVFGPMTGRDWGALCYKHFDHHLRQFGV